MRVFLRVKPTNSAGKFLSSKDAVPFAAIVGEVGNQWVERYLNKDEVTTLKASGIFEFLADDPMPRGNIVRLIGRDVRRDVVKLVCDGGDDGAA